MNVLVISSRDLEKASTKYRIVQYGDFLRTRGVNLEFTKRTEINASNVRSIADYDLVFNQKCLFRSSLAKKIIANSRRTIFDFDDAIYTRPGEPHSWLTSYRVKRRLRLWLERSNLVTTASGVLAHYARRYSSAVIVLPMSIDLEVWKPREQKAKQGLMIGWAGAPVNVPQIERLGPVLASLLARHPSVRLGIFSGRKPNLQCPFEYYPFRPGGEIKFVQSLDIGLLPLTYEEYSTGKSPIKAIQYLSCGVPVVGNVFGATAEILNSDNSVKVSSDDDWVPALEGLVHDRKRIKLMGKAGRNFVSTHHNFKITRERLFRILSRDETIMENISDG